jgi:hypothetical protein
LRAGKGTFTCKKGDLCKGEFVRDEFVSGVYIDVKGSIYKSMEHPDGKPTLNGTFMRGRLVGYGRAEFADGGVYDGTFKDGKRSGQGRMQYNMAAEGEGREGATYTGEWRHNLRHGHGEMLWQSDGARYEGLWHMDRRL